MEDLDDGDVDLFLLPVAVLVDLLFLDLGGGDGGVFQKVMSCC